MPGVPGGAVAGMLRTLDPHSSFFDPKDFQDMREQQRGAYYGVGMTIQPKDSRIIVVAPFTGSPAYKAGIRPGDLVGAITGESGVPSRALGAIEIADRFSLIEVPEEMAEPIITALRGTKLRGQKVIVRRDRDAK